jgi:GNAT superfamily N-acetyltransferase
MPTTLGVIVFSVPIGEWKARNLALSNYFSQYKSKSLRQSAINHNIVYIARIIVDPRFHKIGIASRLLKETIPLFNYHWIETMTPIDKYMSLFTKNGFKLFFQPTPQLYYDMQQALLRAKVDRQYWTLPKNATSVIDALNKYERNLFDSACKKFLRNFHHHEREKKGIARIEYILSKIRYPNAYYLYTNEKVPLI